MGLAPLPTTANHWRKKCIYTSNIPKFTKLGRFELFLRTFHLSNNEEYPTGDRLFKVQGLTGLQVSKYNLDYIPEEDLCIDDSIILFVGRLFFRQYIKNKHHRYGLKVFKLGIKDVHTIGFRVYVGKKAFAGRKV